MLADTFHPGWSASLDSQPVPIRAAYVAFRAVALPAGPHSVVFTYRPAGVVLGLGLTVAGAILASISWFLPGRGSSAVDHTALPRAPRLRTWLFVTLGVIV